MLRLPSYLVILLCFYSPFVAAQKLLYSAPMANRSINRFEVIGKTGSNYWVQKSRLSGRNDKKFREPWLDDKDLQLEVYDNHMNLLKTFPAFALTSNIVKEYFLPANNHLDQLLLRNDVNKTSLVVNRYNAAGEIVGEGKVVGSLPFSRLGNSFLLLRSQDKSKTLLLCFEPLEESSPRLHAMLFNDEWQLLRYSEVEHDHLTQPFIQNDFVDYPLEHFTNAPVKLANNGAWLMAAPSRSSHHFLLFHFKGTDSAFEFHDIKLPAGITVEDISLSLDNNSGEAMAGIVSRVRYPALKHVQVVHYNMQQHRFSFDSSYRFSTLSGNKLRNENLVQEYFMAMPGAGFLLLKEYGRMHNDMLTGGINEEIYKTSGDFNRVFRNDGPPGRKDEYTRFQQLTGTKQSYDRGDLSFFYFPARPNDSCWSGLINKEQITELNSSYLSYLFLPAGNKLFFVYNSNFDNDGQYSSTTVLSEDGHELSGEGLVFWKLANTLQFQRARQIEENEVAIPYERSGREGFAIIRL